MAEHVGLLQVQPRLEPEVSSCRAYILLSQGATLMLSTWYVITGMF